MTSGERSELTTGIEAILGRIEALDDKVDAIERRLDRWDGAITFIKAAASFVGVGGMGLILAALVSAAQK